MKLLFAITNLCFLITVINANAQVGVSQTSSSANVEQHPNLNLLDALKCGPSSTNKISNGAKAALFEFPWMALLEYETNSPTKFLCGGSLINKNYVLTAAHCVKISYKLISVRLGEYDTSTDPDCTTVGQTKLCSGSVQNIPVDQNGIVYHRNYNKPMLSNDIALVRLSRPADLSTDDVKPICLPITEALRTNALSTKLIVTGWGTTEAGDQSSVLLKATISAIPKDQCQKDFENKFIQDEDLCAVSQNASNSCAGDSGGPLQSPAKVGSKVTQPRYVQFGIVSFGKSNCGQSAYANAVYTRVSSFMNWILDNMKP